MKQSIWLFLHFILSADSEIGVLSKSYSEISRSVGRSKSTVRKWLAALEKAGYVTVVRQRKKLLIRVNKWKKLNKSPKPDTIEKQSSRIRTDNVSGFGHIGNILKSRSNHYLSQKMKNQQSYDDKDNNINKNVVNNVVRNSFNLNNGNVRFSSKEESLACEIAYGLNDMANLKVYLFYCRKLPEDVISRVYQEVREKPMDKIKKSRGALFTYLIQKLCKEK